MCTPAAGAAVAGWRYRGAEYYLNIRFAAFSVPAEAHPGLAISSARELSRVQHSLLCKITEFFSHIVQ